MILYYSILTTILISNDISSLSYCPSSATSENNTVSTSESRMSGAECPTKGVPSRLEKKSLQKGNSTLMKKKATTESDLVTATALWAVAMPTPHNHCRGSVWSDSVYGGIKLRIVIPFFAILMINLNWSFRDKTIRRRFSFTGSAIVFALVRSPLGVFRGALHSGGLACRWSLDLLLRTGRSSRFLDGCCGALSNSSGFCHGVTGIRTTCVIAREKFEPLCGKEIGFPIELSMQHPRKTKQGNHYHDPNRL